MRHRLLVHRLTMPASLAKRGEHGAKEVAGDHTFDGPDVDWRALRGDVDGMRKKALEEVARLYPLEKVRAASVMAGGMVVTLEFRR
jgi:hypothetical protein